MKKETKVIFRKFKDGGDIVACFPDMLERNYKISAYQHQGQHCNVDYQEIIQTTKLAKEKEYINLKKELENLGYSLKVMTRANIQYR